MARFWVKTTPTQPTPTPIHRIRRILLRPTRRRGVPDVSCTARRHSGPDPGTIRNYSPSGEALLRRRLRMLVRPTEKRSFSARRKDANRNELPPRQRDVASESPERADVAGCASVDRPDSVAVDRGICLAVAVVIGGDGRVGRKPPRGSGSNFLLRN